MDSAAKFPEQWIGTYVLFLWVRIHIISKIKITRPFASRSWLNFFSMLLLVKKVKSGALIGRNQIKREPKGLGIPLFDITFSIFLMSYSEVCIKKFIFFHSRTFCNSLNLDSIFFYYAWLHGLLIISNFKILFSWLFWTFYINTNALGWLIIPS